jgi:damage-control phosphatase, subfamily III
LLTSTDRRLQGLFRLSNRWKYYDIFARQKMATFRSSRAAVVELAAQYKEIVTEFESSHSLKNAKTQEEIDKAEEAVFIDMCEICLWGNATDLSLLTNLSHDDLQKLQGSQARKASEDKILVNDLSAAFKVLNAAQKSGQKERRVDFILDNAGFELYVDLILAGYLLAVGLATTVVLHPKTIPWFVSDVVPKDFIDLLNALADPKNFYETPSDEDKDSGKKPPALSAKELEDLTFLFEKWGGFHAEGQLVIRPNTFWTEGGSFWRLPGTAPDLYEDLKDSELCIFKGDLNYRKLTADVSVTALFEQPELTFLSNRQCGTQQHHSALQLVPSAPPLVFVSSPLEFAKATPWLGYLMAKMRNYVPKMLSPGRMIAGRRESKMLAWMPGSGHGVASGLSFNLMMGRARLECLLTL